MYEKQLLRFGTWNYKGLPDDKLQVDKEYVEKIVSNYEKSPFAPVVRGHVNNDEIAKNPYLIVNKNISDLSIKEDGLYANLDIDKDEIQKYNDVSVRIDQDAVDHETGKPIGPALRHVALVPDPYIKGLAPFTELSEEKGVLTINLSEINIMKDDKTNTAEVDEKATAEEAPEKEAPETKEAEEAAETVDASEMQSMRDRIVELEEQATTRDKEMARKNAEAKFTALLSEGKITPAQQDAYINLCANNSAVMELSEGKKSTLVEQLDELFSKAPVVVEFSEKGVEIETAEKSDKLKIELKERHQEMSDKEFDKWYEKNEKVIKGANVNKQ